MHLFNVLVCATLLSTLSLLHAAGIKIFTNTPMQVIAFLDNGAKRSVFIASAASSKPCKINAFLAGFEKVQWILPSGEMYEARLKIKWYEGWTIVHLRNSVLIIERNGIVVHAALGQKVDQKDKKGTTYERA